VQPGTFINRNFFQRNPTPPRPTRQGRQTPITPSLNIQQKIQTLLSRKTSLPILIIAGNINQATRYAKEKGIGRRYFRYVAETERVYGFRDCILIEIGDWYENNNYDILKIENYCRAHNIKIIKD